MELLSQIFSLCWKKKYKFVIECFSGKQQGSFNIKTNARFKRNGNHSFKKRNDYDKENKLKIYKFGIPGDLEDSTEKALEHVLSEALRNMV